MSTSKEIGERVKETVGVCGRISDEHYKAVMGLLPPRDPRRDCVVLSDWPWLENDKISLNTRLLWCE